MRVLANQLHMILISSCQRNVPDDELGPCGNVVGLNQQLHWVVDFERLAAGVSGFHSLGFGEFFSFVEGIVERAVIPASFPVNLLTSSPT